jgi:hypothetical protein
MFRRVFALVAGAVALAGMITVSNRAADLPAVAAMAQPAARDGSAIYRPACRRASI